MFKIREGQYQILIMTTMMKKCRMRSEIERTYDISEREERYNPIQANPEDDVIQIHTDSGIAQCEITEPII